MARARHHGRSMGHMLTCFGTCITLQRGGDAPLMSSNRRRPESFGFGIEQIYSQASAFTNVPLNHEAIFQSPVSIHGFIMRYLQILKPQAGVHRNVAKFQLQGRPDESLRYQAYMKINVDGGVAKNANRGTAAAICRDSKGVYMGSSACVIDGCTDPGTLEAIACSEALSLATGLNIHRLIIACDAAWSTRSRTSGKEFMAQFRRRSEHTKTRLI